MKEFVSQEVAWKAWVNFQKYHEPIEGKGIESIYYKFLRLDTDNSEVEKVDDGYEVPPVTARRLRLLAGGNSYAILKTYYLTRDVDHEQTNHDNRNNGPSLGKFL